MPSPAAIASIAAIATLLVASCVHKVPEGYVGVYWRGGALLPVMTQPGYHFMYPLITSFETVQTTLQTDNVVDIPCGTSGGVMIVFEKVEVVNRLRSNMVIDTIRNYTIHYDKSCIFDKIHHEINQFCSSHSLQEVFVDKFSEVDERLATALQEWNNVWAPGIDIIAVRVTKPKIPEKIKQNLEEIESEKTKLLIAEQRQRVVIKQEETEKKRAELEAAKVAEVSKVRMAQDILEKEAAAKISSIENSMFLAQQAAQADAELYRRKCEAEANALLLTPSFLEMERIRAVAANSKVFFGESIPTMFTGDWRGDAAVSASGTSKGKPQ